MSSDNEHSDDSQSEFDAEIDRFEAAWQQGQRPKMADFLPADSLKRAAMLVELAYVELELRLKAGEAVRVEEYFGLFPELHQNRGVAIGLIQSEFRIRSAREPKLSLEEYQRRFPDFYRDVVTTLQQPHQPHQRRHFPARLNCPHCRNPIEIVADSDDAEILCPSCGSSFRLDKDRTQSWAKEKLPTLGKFELLEAVGRGAFGTVYRAKDSELQRIVAVKVPRSGRLATADDEDRFIREARNAAQLSHANIVSVFEVGRSETFPYIVSEFVEGATLSDTLTAKKLGFQKSAELVALIADALEHAHRSGVVHRDLKPSNIMLTPTGVPRVMDFGLAKRDAGEITMTIDGQVLGTPAYMSPEQAAGKSHTVDGRSDVYSLGVILFELLTGELPFRGNVRMLLQQVLHDEPRSARTLNDRIPKDLETICQKAMAKEPERRYSTAADFAADLRRYLSGQPILARPITRLERAWRWSKRKPIAASLLASLVMLVGILSVATILIAQAYRREATLADANKQLAEKEQAASKDADKKRIEAVKAKQEADTVSDFLVKAFSSPSPTLDGRKITVVEVLDRSVQQLELSFLPQSQVKARLLHTIGNTYLSLGAYQQSIKLFEQERSIWEQSGDTNGPQLLSS